MLLFIINILLSIALIVSLMFNYIYSNKQCQEYMKQEHEWQLHKDDYIRTLSKIKQAQIEAAIQKRKCKSQLTITIE